jgi:hypothetical protein
MFLSLALLIPPTLASSGLLFPWVQQTLSYKDQCEVYSDPGLAKELRKLTQTTSVASVVFTPLLDHFDRLRVLPRGFFSSPGLEEDLHVPTVPVGSCTVLTLFAYETYFVTLVKELILFYEDGEEAGDKFEVKTTLKTSEKLNNYTRSE